MPGAAALRGRRVGLRGLLAALLLLSPAGVGQEAQDPVRRELELRSLALGRVVLTAEVEESAWSERYLRLEALRRRAPWPLEPAELELLRSALRDPHPSLREVALLAHAAHELEPRGDLAALEQDPLSAVRAALARALRHRFGEEGDGALLRLAMDPDEGVAREARAQLLLRGAASREAKLELLRGLTDAQLFLDALLALELGPRDEELLRKLDEQLAAEAVPDAAARRALAMTLWREPRLEVLAGGWTTPLHEASFRALRQQRERLEAIAIDLQEEGPRLARLLLEGLQRERVAGPLDLERLERATVLLRGAVLAHHPPRPDGVEPAGFEPLAPDPGWEVELAREFWSLVVGRAPRLGATAALGLRHPDAEVRGLTLEALLDAWRLSGDAETGEQLVSLADDPEFGDEVYVALVGARRVPPGVGRLLAAWRTRSTSRRLSLLEAHLPGRPSWAWRDDLIELWKRGAGRTPAVVERLGDLRGDGEVERALRTFLEAELALMEASPVPAEEVERGPWRDAESRAQVLVRAWQRVRPDRSVAEELALLRRVGRLGREVGKTIIAGLASREEGCDGLLAFAGDPALSRRLRLELALLCEASEGSDAFAELYRAYDELDPELRLRALRRAAGTDDERVRARLEAVARDRREAGVLRLAAAESLGAAGEPAAVVPRLGALLEVLSDPELRSAVVSALGEASDGVEGSPLAGLTDSSARVEGTEDALLVALARAEVRRTTEAGRERLVEAWCGLPELRRDSELRRRFEGERLPARDFAYRGWLGAAEVLARAGRLEDLCADSAWTWDGRLIERLAQAVRDAGGAERLARELDRAALVALEGEAPAHDLVGARVRVRAKLLEAALSAGEGELAARLARAQLEALVAGRATTLALRNAHGARDPAMGRNPLARLARLAASGR